MATFKEQRKFHWFTLAWTFIQHRRDSRSGTGASLMSCITIQDFVRSYSAPILKHLECCKIQLLLLAEDEARLLRFIDVIWCTINNARDHLDPGFL